MKTSLPWFDVDLTTATATYGIRKPINIQRTELQSPRTVTKHDRLTVQYDSPVDDDCWRTPPLEVEVAMEVTHVTKFEVRDEFGCDVGIGFVVGGRRL